MDWAPTGGRAGTGALETRQPVLTWRGDWIAAVSVGPQVIPAPKSKTEPSVKQNARCLINMHTRPKGQKSVRRGLGPNRGTHSELRLISSLRVSLVAGGESRASRACKRLQLLSRAVYQPNVFLFFLSCVHGPHAGLFFGGLCNELPLSTHRTPRTE